MELTIEIRQRLKSAMESRNETGYTIHRNLGISATTIGNYLIGKIKNADNTKMKAICDYLNIDIKWLETGYTDENSENNIVSRSEEDKEEYTKGSIEYFLNKILLAMKAKDDQFSHISKDTRTILDVVNSMKKEVTSLKQELDKLKAENKRLKKE